jgi:hypothetical protein
VKQSLLRIGFLCCLASAVWADGAGPDPIAAAQINPQDSIQTKMNKILFLFNHNDYLFTYAPGSSDFKRLSPQDQKAITQDIQNLGANDPVATRKRDGSIDVTAGLYELDSMRSPSEMLGQRIGGGCGTMAESFAALLAKAGISKDRIRIVSSITNDDLHPLCPGNAGQPKNELYMGGAIGHVFVMVKLDPNDDKSWTLINTTSDPFESNGPKGKHRTLSHIFCGF